MNTKTIFWGMVHEHNASFESRAARVYPKSLIGTTVMLLTSFLASRSLQTGTHGLINTRKPETDNDRLARTQ